MAVAMSDPTPEERAAYEYIKEISKEFDLQIDEDCEFEAGEIARVLYHFDPVIRAAVAAEREGCWQEVLALSSKDLREHESATADVTEYGRHLNRHSAFTEAIAAIRARGDDA